MIMKQIYEYPSRESIQRGASKPSLKERESAIRRQPPSYDFGMPRATPKKQRSQLLIGTHVPLAINGSRLTVNSCIALCSSTNAVNISPPRTMKRFP